MLKQLRSRRVMKRIMLGTLILIIPPFVFYFGWQSTSGRGAEARRDLARVKDRWWGLRWRPITAGEWQLARDSLEREYARIFQSQGLDFSPDQMRKEIGSYEIAREAIDSYYLQRLARREGLEVTRGEIRALLEELFPVQPAESFRSYLERVGQSEAQFIRDLVYRQTLSKAEGYIFSRAKTSLFELWHEYLISQEKIQIRYVRIPSMDFEKEVQPTTDSLSQFYQDHAEDYRIGDRAEFRYVAILRSDVERETEPTTEAVRAFYEKHKGDQLRRKRSARVRHILIEAAPDAPTTAVQAAEQTVRQIAERVKAGEDFAQLADQFSEDSANIVDPDDPTKKRGGLLPMEITEGMPSRFGEEFTSEALSLALDEVSSPVRSAFGFHLIRADSVTTAGIVPFDEVREQARRLLRLDLVDAEFRKRGEALRELFAERSYSTLDSFAEAAGLQIGRTGLVDLEAGFLPEIGLIRDDLELIREFSEGEFTEGVLKNSGAYYVLELHRKVPSHIPPFVEVADDVRDDYITSQAAYLAHEVASELFRQAENLEDLEQAAQQRGYEVTQSDPFTRDRADTVLPALDPRFAYTSVRYKVGTIYLTTQGDPELPTACIVWYFEKREPPTLAQFRKDLPALRAEYQLQIQQALVQEWLRDMRRRIRAEINPVFEAAAQESEGESG